MAAEETGGRPHASAASEAWEPAAGCAQPAPNLYRLFDVEISHMHCVPADPAPSGRMGRLWTVDPAFGTGEYWYYPIDDLIAVTAFDLRFHQDLDFMCDTPDCVAVGSYGRNMLPYFGRGEDRCDRVVLGYVWRGRSHRQIVRADEHLTVTSLALLPQALPYLARRLGCEPAPLVRAVTALDGRHDVIGLNAVLDDMRMARPSAAMARAYYEAKVIEALVLLYDWGLSHWRHRGSSLTDADLSALNYARAHIHDHLEQGVTTEELCRLVCMSPSKLTRLFKQAEGTTVQGYVRALRMERACELLVQGESSMAQLAERLGFSCQGSFSKAFKTCYGVPPHVYRAARRNVRRA